MVLGLVTSRLGAYGTTMMMGTDTMLHFRDEMQRQQQTAAAAGQMQAIQQVTGAGGGVSGGSGWTGQSWYGITATINSIALIAVPLAIAIAIAVYIMKGSQVMMFGAVCMGVFFLIERFLFSIQWGKAGIVNGQNLLISLFMGLIIGAFVGFAAYNPPKSEDTSKNDYRDPTYYDRQNRTTYRN